MAGNNSVKFLRGTAEKIAASTEVLVEGQPIYNLDKNYLTVGNGTGVNGKPVKGKPITVREVIAYAEDTDAAIGDNFTDEVSSIKTDSGILKITGISGISIDSNGDIILASSGAGTDQSTITIAPTGVTVDESITAFSSVTAPNITAATGINTGTLTATGLVTAPNITAATGINTGTLTATGLVTAANFNSSSDIRLKTEVRKSELSALPVVNEIDIYEYKFKNDPGAQNIGIIAQEAEKINIENNIQIVSEHIGEYKSINLNNLVFILWKAVQELSEEVKTLSQKVKE